MTLNLIRKKIDIFLKDNVSSNTKILDNDQTKTDENKNSQAKNKKGDQVFTSHSYDDLRAGDFDFVLDEGKFVKLFSLICSIILDLKRFLCSMMKHRKYHNLLWKQLSYFYLNFCY